MLSFGQVYDFVIWLRVKGSPLDGEQLVQD